MDIIQFDAVASQPPQISSIGVAVRELCEQGADCEPVKMAQLGF
jgi:hypothetical protein